MLDQPGPANADSFAAIRAGLDKAGLPEIFRAGDRLATLARAGTPDGTQIQRVAVIGSVTLDYLARAIACAIAQEGVLADLYIAPFGAWIQEVLDPGSGLRRFAPELVVIAADQRDLIADLPPGAPAETVDEAVSARVARFTGLWDILAGQMGARVLQHLPPPPPNRLRGPAERAAAASPAAQVHAVNTALIRAGGGRVAWIDLESLANEIGAHRFAAPRHYHTAKLGFDPRYLPDYLAPFRAAWRAATARAKKALILDLDNTIWGGVIGDDGVEGIVLGPGTPDGEAFHAFQTYARDLARRGVVLAACSKNAPEIALNGLAHPNSLLTRADFAAFECSWNDKAGGLRRIAEALNLGLDSFVFADDNPAECALVRRELPQVAVVELGTDPSQFIGRLDAGGWFDLPAYTTEDFGRGAAYAARAAAADAQAGAADLDTYLAGLGMVGRLYRPDEADIGRVAQLEQKTNQFNLTTRRYSEDAVRAFLARPDADLYAFRLRDQFGDHGLVSTVIAVAEGDTLRIDSWLMSCRVFSRTAEQFILRGLIARARERGLARIAGTYAPTAKNGVVADLWDRMGFARDGEHWILHLADAADPVTHIAEEIALREAA